MKLFFPPMAPLAFLAMVLVLAGSACAAGAEEEKILKLDASQPRAIPYPFRGNYASEGLSASLAWGAYFGQGPQYEYESLTQWEGEVAFYYLPYFSAGAGGKILAGEPERNTAFYHDQYQFFARLHKVRGPVAAFLGAEGGVLLSGFSKDTTRAVAEQFNRQWGTGMVGLQTGLGWDLGGGLGLTLGAQAEHFFNLEALFRVAPGVSYDLTRIIPGLDRQARGFFIHLEEQEGWVKDFRSPKRDRERSWVLGASAVF